MPVKSGGVAPLSSTVTVDLVINRVHHVRVGVAMTFAALVGVGCGGEATTAADRHGGETRQKVTGLPDAMAIIGDDLVVAHQRSDRSIELARHRSGGLFDDVGVVTLPEGTVTATSIQLYERGDEVLLVGNACSDPGCERSAAFGFSIGFDGRIDEVALPKAPMVWMLGAGDQRVWLRLDDRVVEVGPDGVRPAGEYEPYSCVSPKGEVVSFDAAPQSVLDGGEPPPGDEVDRPQRNPVEARAVVRVDGAEMSRAAVPVVGIAEVICAADGLEVTDTSSDLWMRYTYVGDSLTLGRPDPEGATRVPAAALSTHVTTDGRTAWSLGIDDRPLTLTLPETAPGNMSPTAAGQPLLQAIAMSTGTKLALCWAGASDIAEQQTLEPATCEVGSTG